MIGLDLRAPMRVEVHAAVGRVLAQESQVLAGPGPAQYARGALLRRCYDHVQPPHLAGLRQVVAEYVIVPAGEFRCQAPCVLQDNEDIVVDTVVPVRESKCEASLQSFLLQIGPHNQQAPQSSNSELLHVLLRSGCLSTRR